MYGQEIDAYEKQESTNHEQDLNNFLSALVLIIVNLV